MAHALQQRTTTTRSHWRFNRQQLTLQARPQASSLLLIRGNSAPASLGALRCAHHLLSSLKSSIISQPTQVALSRHYSIEWQHSSNWGFARPGTDYRDQKLRAVATGESLYPVEELEKGQEQACILQAFNWGSWRRKGRSWYQLLLDNVDTIKEGAFTDVILPPCCQSLDPQGERRLQIDCSQLPPHGQVTAVLSIG